MIIIKIISVLALFVILYLAALSFIHRESTIKHNVGDDLSPCPNKPNCVLSLSSKNRESIPALELLNNDKKESWNKLIKTINEMGGIIMLKESDSEYYLHAVFSSFIFRFKDDFEAQIKNGKIEIRSASRAGTSDLGQNRKRVEELSYIYLN